jgi:YidC/Oxa1 family membrane protein insertase
MSTEARFILALGLVFGVIWGTNQLFPPVLPELETAADSTLASGPGGTEGARSALDGGTAFADSGVAARDVREGSNRESVTLAGTAGQGAEPIEVSVETPLVRFVFDARGARLREAELMEYGSLREGNGRVHLVAQDMEILSKRLVTGADTVDLSEFEFTVEPREGLRLLEPGDEGVLTFRWSRPETGAEIVFRYGFHADRYVVDVQSEVRGVGSVVLEERIAQGIPFSEADSAQELASMAWVGNHLNGGIDAHRLDDVEGARLEPGPFTWVGVKNKYFLIAMLPGGELEGTDRYLGGVSTRQTGVPVAPSIAASIAYDASGAARYRLYLGPQEYSRLQSIGDDLEEVNPYGWKWLRPVIRPFVGLTLWVLSFLHGTLNVGYGWVLVIFGVLMRVLLWPLNQKAMRSQMRNMAVQPLLKEVQAKYKDNPERLQKEMLRLHKEYGFNPLGGCLPMLVPWPVLIALFFVFQNTIELRGVPFLWLPDLSAKDPFYALPAFMAVSMFALQWISFRSMPDQGNNAQMKAMMYFMPLFFGFIFMQFPSGLNLYYAVTNVATIPQQILIARERKAVAGRGPVKVKQD